MSGIDAIRLNFTPESLIALDVILAFVLFGVALDMRVQDFRGIVTAPRGTLIGLLAHSVLLPAVAFALTILDEFTDPLPPAVREAYDLVDLRTVAPQKPFFMYYCLGAGHAPHQVEREWIERYRGRFDCGWDKWREEVFARQLKMGIVPPGTKIAPRPDQVKAWDALSADAKKLYARQMEVYAAYLAYTDHEIGRVIQEVQDEGKLDNTLIIYISGDNGASAEGMLNGTPNEFTTFNGVQVPVDDGGAVSAAEHTHTRAAAARTHLAAQARGVAQPGAEVEHVVLDDVHHQLAVVHRRTQAAGEGHTGGLVAKRDDLRTTAGFPHH